MFSAAPRSALIISRKASMRAALFIFPEVSLLLGQFFLGFSFSGGMRTLISAFFGSTNIASATIVP